MSITVDMACKCGWDGVPERKQIDTQNFQLCCPKCGAVLADERMQRSDQEPPPGRLQ